MANKLFLYICCGVFSSILFAKEPNMLDFLHSLEPTLKKINVSLKNYTLDYVSLNYNPVDRNTNYKNLEFKTYGDNKIVKKGYIVVYFQKASA